MDENENFVVTKRTIWSIWYSQNQTIPEFTDFVVKLNNMYCTVRRKKIYSTVLYLELKAHLAISNN